jgi:epoxyqueuosine reductase
VAVALGNSGNPEAIFPLRAALGDPEPLVRGHAAWALGQFAEPQARLALQQHLVGEEDEQVRAEVLIALGEEAKISLS